MPSAPAQIRSSFVYPDVASRRPARALRFRERRFVPWLLLLADIGAVETSIALGCAVRTILLPAWPVALGPAQYRGLILGALLLPAAYACAGLYPGYGLGAIERLHRRIKTTVFVFVGLIAWDYLVQHGDWSRGVLVGSFGFALCVPVLLEVAVISLLIRSGRWGTPVLVAGAGDGGAALIRQLISTREVGLVPVGFFHDGQEPRNYEIDGIPALGPASVAHLYAGRASTIVFADPRAAHSALMRAFERPAFRRILVVPDLPGIQTHCVVSRDLSGVLALELERNLLITHNRWLKRALDVALAAPFFLLSVPLLAAAAICIKLAGPGPVFYCQSREGLAGRPIRVWKLRTMRPDAERVLHAYLDSNPAEAEQWRRFFKLKNDPRILPYIGSLLRKTSIDELPQLWNVIRGEMSLVGPRPFPEYHLRSFDADFRRLRQSVRPGVTGLWQVSGRGDGDTIKQQSLDGYYIRNWSPWLDLYILALTPRAVCTRRGAY